MTMAPAPAASRMQVRLTFGDNWITRMVPAKPDESIASVKARFLQSFSVPADQAGGYEVKHAGVPVRDESRSLSALGMKNGAPLIIQARRRRPVR